MNNFWRINGLVISYQIVGFEVLTAVVMKSTNFWDISPCSPLKVNRRFGRTYRLHLQGRISRARYQRDNRWQAECHLLSRWYLVRLIRPWRWRQYLLPKRQLTFSVLNGVISKKIVPFDYKINYKQRISCWCTGSLINNRRNSSLGTWLNNVIVVRTWDSHAEGSEFEIGVVLFLFTYLNLHLYKR
jgi:hypothetical protein